MIKAIALDDEPLALQIIESFCKQIPEITLEKSFTSHTSALKHIGRHPVDLLFLDIQMPAINGISFYKSLEQSIPVIFTTAFHDYAVEGFNVNAIDYLVKPFLFERFSEAVKKAVLRKSILVDSNTIEFISVRSNYKLHKIVLEDILFIQALDNYVVISMKSGQKLTVQTPLKEMLLKLPGSKLVRIHRSYIVNLIYIKTFNLKTVHINGNALPVGEKYKENLDILLR